MKRDYPERLIPGVGAIMTVFWTSRVMAKIKAHLTVFLIATIFGFTAYGFIHLLIYAIRSAQRLFS